LQHLISVLKLVEADMKAVNSAEADNDALVAQPWSTLGLIWRVLCNEWFGF